MIDKEYLNSLNEEDLAGHIGSLTDALTAAEDMCEQCRWRGERVPTDYETIVEDTRSSLQLAQEEWKQRMEAKWTNGIR